MPNAMDQYNCGVRNLGGWARGRPTENQLASYEQEIKEIVEQAKAGWYKMIICTVLKNQDDVRKLLRKYGFRKTPEALSKYDPTNTQCIYYWDSNALKPKKVRKSK